MNHKAKIIPNIVLPGILTISGVAGIIAIATTTNTSALTYSSDTDVSFTFDPTLSISLSNANINIDNLLPGLSSESSPITVHVNSNTPYGYSLFASVGNSTDYNTTSLVHKSNDNSNNKSNDNNNINSNSNNNSIPATFTSIATNASLPQLDTDNTWGYSFSNDNGTTWSNYNGLPLYSTVGNNTSTNNPALLIDTKSPADSTESIDFKIAAKASSTQASGTYNNIINFYAVGKPEPYTIDKIQSMQDFRDLTTTDKQSILESMPIGEQYKLVDNRDNNTYWVARQADDNIWMTQNLDLCIGCEGTATLTSQNTDLNQISSNQSHPYSSKYGYLENEDGLIWEPVATAITSDPSATSRYYLPYSEEGNDVYVYTFDTNTYGVTYVSLDNCIDAGHDTDCDHHHVGNYYNWNAAVATNNSVYWEYSTGITAANSICPAGWRLPTGMANNNKNPADHELHQLFYMSGVKPNQSFNQYNDSYTSDGFIRLSNSPLFFVRGGAKNFSVDNLARVGQYWSSTANGSSAVYVQFLSNSISPAVSAGNRSHAVSVRCIVR